VLVPEQSFTATGLKNLALMQLTQANAPAADPLLQRLNHGQAAWLRPELPLQPRDLRGSLIDAAIAEAVAGSAASDRPVEAPAWLEAVSKLVLKPLEAELAGVGDRFVSPDADLNHLPFAAQPMGTAGGIHDPDRASPESGNRP